MLWNRTRAETVRSQDVGAGPVARAARREPIRPQNLPLPRVKVQVETLPPAEDVGFELKILLGLYQVSALTSTKCVASRRLGTVRRRFTTGGAAKCRTDESQILG